MLAVMVSQILYRISNSEERTSWLCKEDFVVFMLNFIDEITNGILTQSKTYGYLKLEKKTRLTRVEMCFDLMI